MGMTPLAAPDALVEDRTRLAEIATRDVIQLGDRNPIADAVRVMAERKISSIVITGDDAAPCGIVTEQDILGAMQAKLSPALPLQRIMSAPILTVPADMHCYEAYLLCLREGNQHLVLVDAAGGVAGLVTETDFRLHINMTTLSGRRPASTVMSRGVLSLPPEAVLADALDLMRGQEESCVVVTDGLRPVGIITERDVVRLYHQNPDQGDVPLERVMTSPVVSVPLDASLSDVADRMSRTRSRHLVVTDPHGGLAGLITEHDLTQVVVVGLVDKQYNADRTFLRTLLDSIPDLVWLKDPNGIYLACNRQYEKLCDPDGKGMVGKTDFDFLDRATALVCQETDQRAVMAGEPTVSEEWNRRAPDGGLLIFETLKTPVLDHNGRLIGVLGIARDITLRKRDELMLAESQALLTAVMDSTDNMIWSVDTQDFGLLTFNAGLHDYIKARMGLSIAKGMRPAQILPTEDQARTWEKYYRRALAEGAYTTEYVTWAGDLVLQLKFNVLRRDGKAFGISVFGENITERKLSEARIQYLAYHDPLTGLPNRALAQERFKLAVSYASRAKARLALLLLDLDNFKTVNDALGHQAGDRLLKIIADRLVAGIREADTVSRLGGDGFQLLLTDIQDLDQVAQIANRVRISLQEPLVVDGHSLTVTVSTGIAIYPDDAEDLDRLMAKADTALAVVKSSGRNDFRFFDEKFNTVTVEALAIQNELHLALERGEFLVHYQPQIDFASGRLIGAEALLRWHSPTRGMVGPADFIPVAEDSGLIIEIGAWVLDEACRQAAEWRRDGVCPDLSIAVNMSALQFARGNVVSTVMAALEKSGLPPAALELELTESILVKNPEEMRGIIVHLKQVGIRLAIDDFGTGYSSLSYLKRLPVDKLKIDQSFVLNMATKGEDAAIVRATIQMAHALGLRTIAEGIEDATTAQGLRLYDCDEAQGYYFSRPLPAAAFKAFALAWRDNPFPAALPVPLA